MHIDTKAMNQPAKCFSNNASPLRFLSGGAFAIVVAVAGKLIKSLEGNLIIDFHSFCGFSIPSTKN